MWHSSQAIHDACAADIREVANTEALHERQRKALGFIASRYASLPRDFDHGRFASTLAMAALYPLEFRQAAEKSDTQS